MSAVHLDYSVLSTLQEIMEDEYPTLLEVFLKDSEQRVSRFRQLMMARSQGLDVDMQEMGMLAHSFKGSSSNMGALQLANLCLELEERSRHEQRSGLEALLASIQDEYLTVRRLFDAERQFFIAQS